MIAAELTALLAIDQDDPNRPFTKVATFGTTRPRNIKVIAFQTESDHLEFESLRLADQYGFYVHMRTNGESHRMAFMLATRSFPGVKTDAVFNEGKFSGQGQGDCEAHGIWNRQQAESAGVSTTGKWYCSGLASFPGDPTAWVDSRGDVLRIAREKNMTVRGYVEHKGHEVDPGEDKVIADSIIDDEVNDILDSNPFANADEVRQEVYQLRTGAVDNNPLLVKDYDSVLIP